MKLQWDRWGLDKAMMAKQFSSMLHVATASRDPNETWTAKVGKTQKNTKIHLNFFINKHVFCLYFMCFVFLFCFLVRPHHCSQLHKSIPELLDLRKSVSGSRTVASVRTAWIHRNPLEFLESSRGFTLRFHTDLGCGGLHISCTTWSIKTSKNFPRCTVARFPRELHLLGWDLVHCKCSCTRVAPNPMDASRNSKPRFTIWHMLPWVPNIFPSKEGVKGFCCHLKSLLKQEVWKT